MKAKHISSEEKGGQGTTDDAQDPADEADSPSEEPPFSKDEIFHLLQNERRRMVLRYLRGTNGPVRMRDVAEQVAAWEHDTTVEGLTSTQRQRVYIPLYQSHLSKLDNAGLIEYQKNRGIVERKPLADRVDTFLELDPSEDSPDETAAESPDWQDSYIFATVVSYAILLGAVMEMPFTSLLSGIGLSALILSLFTVLTIRRLVN
ncbi:hypothetical protein NP511_06000 [Natrinema thermotolerans]|uniref:DUF7344 domain-containing protein n=1 Tax=Natrinema thermotolerans TaxID=121872 RepID=A0AAF0T773_9EURY|nr:hypothetical protein [Natrinema thermotolerans]QCC58085.1 hypothetical protein DVR14_05290 [Natrinema thermotolerans]WMT09184.1 hypothetical protein NP511_06000 [Natrinema thermotolerans]